MLGRQRHGATQSRGRRCGPKKGCFRKRSLIDVATLIDEDRRTAPIVRPWLRTAELRGGGGGGGGGGRHYENRTNNNMIVEF